MCFSNLEDAVWHFRRYPEICHELWVEARWPEGVHCPHCGAFAVDLPFKKCPKKCNDCRNAITLTGKSRLERSSIKLADWMVIIWAVSEGKKYSALSIARALELPHSKTLNAFRYVQKIMQNVRRFKFNWRQCDRFYAITRAVAQDVEEEVVLHSQDDKQVITTI